MKKTTTLLTEISIYIVFLLVALFSFTFDVNSQTIVKDAAGNYQQIKDTTARKSEAKLTGKYYTTLDGEKLPIYESKNGKLFVIRISRKSNKPYNFYLKTN